MKKLLLLVMMMTVVMTAGASHNFYVIGQSIDNSDGTVNFPANGIKVVKNKSLKQISISLTNTNVKLDEGLAFISYMGTEYTRIDVYVKGDCRIETYNKNPFFIYADASDPMKVEFLPNYSPDFEPTPSLTVVARASSEYGIQAFALANTKIWFGASESLTDMLKMKIDNEGKMFYGVGVTELNFRKVDIEFIARKGSTNFELTNGKVVQINGLSTGWAYMNYVTVPTGMHYNNTDGKFYNCDNDEVNDGYLKALWVNRSSANYFGDNIKWSIEEDCKGSSTLYVGGYGDMPDVPYSKIPWTKFKDLVTDVVIQPDIMIPLNNICDSAFAGFTELTDVVIEQYGEDGITKIGKAAFSGCDQIGKLPLPDDVEEIGDSAFFGCSSIELVLPKSLKTLGMQPFVGCARLIMPKDMNQNITNNNVSDKFSGGASQFYGEDVTLEFKGTMEEWLARDNSWIMRYWGLSNKKNRLVIDGKEVIDLVVPNGTTELKNHAFQNCMRMESATFPATLTKIGDMAFCNCENLAAISLPVSISEIGEYCFDGCLGATSLTISGGMTELPEGAFSDCESLTEVKIPEGITTIGEGAFDGCFNLEKVTLPATLTKIDQTAFWGCANLVKAVVPTGIGNVEVEMSFPSYPDYLPFKDVYEVYVDGKIEDWAKGNRKWLMEKITFNSTLYLGSEAPTEIVIPDGITEIGEYAFANLGSVNSITLPANLQKIKEGAFKFNMGISAMVVPESVTEIGADAFKGCNFVASVYCDRKTPAKLGDDAFMDINIPSTLYVPKSAVAAYEASDWAKYFTNITGVTDYATTYVCDFTSTAAKNTHYNTEWKYTKFWSVFGAANNDGKWKYAKFGGKNTTISDANPSYVVNTRPFGKEVCKVRVSLPEGSLANKSMSVKEWGVKVYKDVNMEDLMFTIKSDVAITGKEQVIEVTPEKGKSWTEAQCIMVYFDLENTSGTNGIVWVSKVEYLTDADDKGKLWNVPEYIVTATASHDDLGEVTMSADEMAAKDGDNPTWWAGTVLHLEAKSKGSLGKFVGWNDNSPESANDVRDIVVDKDFDYIARFEKDSFVIEVTVEGIDPGLVVINGAGKYGRGDNATLSFTLKDTEHYTFEEWHFDKNNFEEGTSLEFENIDSHHDVKILFKANYYAVKATVTPAGAGVVKGQGDYEYNTNYTLTLEPTEGYELKEWRDGEVLGEKTNVLTGLVYGEVNIEVVLQLKKYTITTAVNDENMGTVTGAGQYEHGSTATLTAIPNSGYRFVKWDFGATDNPLKFTVNDNSKVTAIFESLPEYTLTVIASPADGGQVMGGGTYQSGKEVQLIAVANSGFNFVEWSDGVKDAIRKVVVTEDAIYTAKFEKQEVKPNEYDITVLSADETMGTVTGSGTFDEGSEIEIKAIANEGYEFVRWNDSNTDNPRKVTVTKDQTFIANFQQKAVPVPQYTISVFSANLTMGSVEGGGTFDEGSEIEIKAIANEGYEFIRWNDGNTDNPRKVTVTKDQTFIANFQQKAVPVLQYTITVLSADPTMGSVDGSGKFDEGSEIEIKAIATEGYEFTKWNDGNTDNPRKVTVTKDQTFIANFQQKAIPVPQYTIIVLSADPTMGSVEGGGKFDEGSEIEIKAIANEGYEFVRWNDSNTDNPRKVTVTKDQTFIANFQQKAVPVPQYTITVLSADPTMGSVDGGGTFDAGSEIEINAIATEGYEFTKWNDGNTDNPRKVTVTKDQTFIANFWKIIIDYTPKNMQVKVTSLEDKDTQISFSWDAVEGAASYELSVIHDGEQLLVINTIGQNTISVLLSEIVSQTDKLVSGTYRLDWQVRSVDAEKSPLSEWAHGERFEVTIEVPDGVEEVSGQPSTVSRKVIINGHVYILMPDGKTYDANGKMVR